MNTMRSNILIHLNKLQIEIPIRIPSHPPFQIHPTHPENQIHDCSAPSAEFGNWFPEGKRFVKGGFNNLTEEAIN